MLDIKTQYQYAQVLVDIDAKALDRRTFSYRIPEGLETVVDVGLPVLVPFGRMKQIAGYIVGFTNYVEPGIRVKDILDVLDESPLFDLEYLNFLDWVGQYYATQLMTVLSTALPSSVIQKTKREVFLTGEDLPSEQAYALSLPAKQVLTTLKDRQKKTGIGVRYLASATGLPLRVLNQALYKLKELGVVTMQSRTTGAMKGKTVSWVQVIKDADTSGLTPRQTALWESLNAYESDFILTSQAIDLAKTTKATLQKLAQTSVIALHDLPEHRDQGLIEYYRKGKSIDDLTLNDEQQVAVHAVLKDETPEPHLLYGVTGAGKTEVYMALTQAMVKQGKTVLILVPEISLTSHIAKRFIERFGTEQLTLWHSQLSAGEKVDAWRRINQGDLKIVIGARSAIFAPMKNLGLIVMDEEHEGSYKQDSPAPRYHAKTLAIELAKRSGARLLLGSATPDIETYYAALNSNRILTLKNRFGGRKMAAVDVVDMRQAKSASNAGSMVSATLEQALAHTIEKGEQAILLLNRRGFYTLIICNNCQYVFECPHCSVAVTYHRFKNNVRCHYCGYEAQKPQFCTQCASFDLTFTGLGTQRLEESIKESLPEARLLRLDSDVMTKKFAHRDIFEAFGAHEADILMGTQMVAKGLDVPNVTLVGVIGADTAFSLPDYKASERGFQLLTQVAGRSGRGEKPGRVLIQSLQPSHPVLLRAQDQDYLGFYEDEIARRQEFDFPPYSQLFRLIISCPDELRARHFAEAVTMNLRQILQEATLDPVVQILGPAPCVIARIQGRFRFHVMIKNKYGQVAHEIITQFYRQVQPPPEVNFLIDVDAQSFL